MSLEMPQGNASKQEAKVFPWMPYDREDLLETLRNRLQVEAGKLEALKAGPMNARAKKALREHSERVDTLTDAIKKFSNPSKQELDDPATLKQVWISSDFHKRLGELGEEHGREAEAFMREKEAERDVEEAIAAAKRKQELDAAFPELTTEEQARWQSEKLKRLGSEEAEMKAPKVSDEMELSEADLTPETEDEAYVRKLGERIQAAGLNFESEPSSPESAELAGEDTQVNFEMDEDPFAALLSTTEGTLPEAVEEEELPGSESGVRKARERTLESLQEEALGDLEKWARSAMRRYREIMDDVKSKASHLEMRLMEQEMLGSGEWGQKRLEKIQATLRKLDEDADAAWNDVLMIEKQIASLRAEMMSEAATKPIDVEKTNTAITKPLEVEDTVPDAMVVSSRSRRRKKG